jgi:hypothetical protein
VVGGTMTKLLVYGFRPPSTPCADKRSLFKIGSVPIFFLFYLPRKTKRKP